jgi:ankyrin repeat protein
MTTTDDFFAAIDAGQADRVRSNLDAEASLAAARDGEGVSAVMHALYHRQREVAEVVAGRLPALDVFEAAGLGRVDEVASLVAGDPSLAGAWSADGFTALHFAAFFGGGDVAAALIAAGADPNLRSRNELEVMPIHSAVAGGRRDVVVVLLEAGADPNVRQRHGWTPLQGAAQNGDAELVDRLLAAGADPAAVNDGGTSAADLARLAGHADLAARIGSLAEGAASGG